MLHICENPFDASFIDRVGQNRYLLYMLFQKANDLDIVDLCLAKIASLVKAQPT